MIDYCISKHCYYFINNDTLCLKCGKCGRKFDADGILIDTNSFKDITADDVVKGLVSILKEQEDKINND